MKNWQEVEGTWFSPEEGAALQELAKDKVCVEIGSYKGRSTVCLAEVAKHVHAVDTFRADFTGQNQLDTFTTLDDFKKNTEGYPVTAWIGNSIEISKNFKPNTIDLIFIDALHTYQSVRDDIFAWWKILKFGGIMLFHDFNIPPTTDFPPDVTRAV